MTVYYFFMSTVDVVLWFCIFYLCFRAVLDCLYFDWMREKVIMRKELFLRRLKINRVDQETQTETQTEGQTYLFPPPPVYSNIYSQL